eukprot:TRINITY_DN62364_c0_g1_i1.p1 TRINITY_DN62364_c0_g1~~TRINITY_DN62364_c0_g1_i1.p1  ORF type:complete len:174 (+),score=21.25 TRINITY_DN62364_c0_g1_i1:119-640(+)
MSFAPPGGMQPRDPESLPVFSGGLYNTAQVTVWKEILTAETQMARDWDGKWAFCKAPQRRQRSLMRRDKAEGDGADSGQPATAMMNSSASAPSLSAAGREVLGGGSLTPANNANDGLNDRQRVLEKRRSKVPRERFARQQTANHAHGWRPSLETFGVSQFGRRVCKEPGIRPN